MHKTMPIVVFKCRSPRLACRCNASSASGRVIVLPGEKNRKTLAWISHSSGPSQRVFIRNAGICLLMCVLLKLDEVWSCGTCREVREVMGGASLLLRCWLVPLELIGIVARKCINKVKNLHRCHVWLMPLASSIYSVGLNDKPRSLLGCVNWFEKCCHLGKSS